MGLKLGGGGYEFTGKYLTKGCYAYTNESRGFAGMTYYSTGGTDKEMKEAPTIYNQYRPFGYDCKGNTCLKEYMINNDISLILLIQMIFP